MLRLSLDRLKERVNQEVGVSDYFEITQDHISAFAAITGDEQWIHVDPERAMASVFKRTIAHGFLTLSLISRCSQSVVRLEDVTLGLILGLNYARFIAPVPAGSRVRGRFQLKSWRDITDASEVTWIVTLEMDAGIPCCIAEWIVRYYRQPALPSDSR